MKAFRIPSLVLAGVLQILPLARVAAVLQQPAAPLWAILMRWAGAAAAALGSVQAVSGASTTITNPLTAKGTNGIPFKQFRLTTAPDQAHYWAASGLPDGIVLTGKSGQTFWALSGTPTTPGVFNVRLTAKDQINSGGDRTVSATLVITIVDNGTAPTITTQPISQTVTAGSSATFSVSANGTAPFIYQWRKDGQNIATGTGSSLALPSVTSSDAGTYTVLVSNSIGSVLSQGATLTVNTPVLPPSISSQPVGGSVTVGNAITLSISAFGTAPFTYQWKRDGQAISGANASTFSIAAAALSDSGAYTVVVSNSAGTVTSDPANVVVTSPVSGPTISSQPTALSVHGGQNATFSVTAGGTEPLDYQWFHGGTAIPGATGSSVTLNSVAASDAGNYSVEVRNSAGTAHSTAATLNVTVLQILSAMQTGDSTVLSWTGLAGEKYSIVAVNSLGEPWTPLSISVPPDSNGLVSVTVPNLMPGQFFRVSAYP